MDLATSMMIAASGMRAQSSRMRIIAENIANANSTSPTANGDPYRRKIATMPVANSTASWTPPWCEAGKPVEDQSDFRLQYDPGNPAADKQGYVKLPNVNPLVEIMDMREAQRSYEADLTVMDCIQNDAVAHRRSAPPLRENRSWPSPLPSPPPPIRPPPISPRRRPPAQPPRRAAGAGFGDFLSGRDQGMPSAPSSRASRWPPNRWPARPTWSMWSTR